MSFGSFLHSGRGAVVAVVTVIAVLALLPGAAIAGGGSPVLGQTSGPNQRGYGEARPSVIFNGGDPTGFVGGIRWSHWGAKRATGWGYGLFVWPGLAVAEGQRAKARVVAYHLGTCGGVRSYNAVQWFFPRYGQRFHPGEGGSICAERHPHFSGYHPRHCANLALSRFSEASSITALHLSCRRAKTLIRTSQVRRYAISGGRFRHRGYYCGSSGWGGGEPPALFQCALDLRSVTFEVYTVV
jgi:hypothetical protein